VVHRPVVSIVAIAVVCPTWPASVKRCGSQLRSAASLVFSRGILGGEPSSRLTNLLAITTSPDTLIRRVKQLDAASHPPPRVVGIDDWAWRRGRSYGTIVVDLERGNVIDLLPDRDAATVKQ